jgi:hypothetical protein
MAKRKSAAGWTERVFEPFQALVTDAQNEQVPLRMVRDALFDHLIGDKDENHVTVVKHVVLLVLTVDSAVSDLSSAIETHADLKTCARLNLRSRLADGDAVPKCDATLLFAPVSKQEQERAKKEKTKAIKKRIKKFKKQTKGSEIGPAFYLATDEDVAQYYTNVPFDSINRQGTPQDGCILSNAVVGGETTTTIEPEFVETRPMNADHHQDCYDSPVSTAQEKMIAVDCEMCKTTKGIELTRVSLVSEQHEVISISRSLICFRYHHDHSRCIGQEYTKR